MTSILVFMGLTMILMVIMAIVGQRSSQQHQIAMKELEVRALEAQAKLAEANKLGELPEYVDKNDPIEVEAWRAARAEMAKATAKQL